MLLGQGLSLISQAVYFLVLARLLGSAQYGIYAGAFALATIAAQFSAVGSDTVMLRYVSADRGLFHVYWGNTLVLISGASLLLTLLLYGLGGAILKLEDASMLAMASISQCFCIQLTQAAGRAFQAFEAFRTTATIGFLTNILRMLTAAAMLAILHRATAGEWMLASLLVSLFGTGLSVYVVCRKLGAPKFHLELVGRHFKEGLQYAFSTSTACVYNDLDKTLLSHYGMNAANGIYSMAYRVVDIASIPVFALRDAAMPGLFVEGHKGLGSALKRGKGLLQKSLILSLLGAIGIWLVAPIVPKVVGRGFLESATALRWLCLIPVFRSLHQMMGAVLTGSGRQSYRTASQCAAAVLNLCLNLWLIPLHGWYGAAVASLITDGCLGVVNWAMVVHLSRAQLRPTVATAA